ncbi:CCAAT-binding factor complex subunit HapE [Aspergillus arachidicola]|uniref:CCAAT-binding factor complex subunit HapE n=1 Tax=Aspergillus arachidicola TaxID=656916 RepID=A0A2G7FL54_9EURO|nr:CCAAT-binding factor complex subunit HapE [Aspergillus arachidicola]
MEQSTQNASQQQGRQQPVYDTRNGGHYGASAALSAQGYAPVAELYTGTWANVNQGLQGTARDILTTYWQHIINHLESDNHDYKIHQLPLARIKKVMKADPEVKMISAEAPILFAKGCDIFITELTMRAWIHAEDNKRRTLQRSDIAAALSKSDMFDFLIDIVPREEATSHAKRSSQAAGAPSGALGLQALQDNFPHPSTECSTPHITWHPPTTVWASMVFKTKNIVNQLCTRDLCNQIRLQHMVSRNLKCLKECMPLTRTYRHSRYVQDHLIFTFLWDNSPQNYP